MPALSTSKKTQLQSATGLSTSNIDDLEWSFYSANSGLTPPNKFSVADHKLAFYKLNGALGKSLAEVERSYFSLSGASGNDYDSLALDFYTNYGYGPKSISGLALWLDSANVDGSNNATLVDGQAISQWNDISGNGRHVAQATGANQPLFRSAAVNLLKYDDATMEVAGGNWVGNSANTNVTASKVTSQAQQGAASLQLVAAGIGDIKVSTWVTGNVVVSPNVTYTAVAYFKAAVTTRSCQVTVDWKDSGNGYISTSNGSAITNTTTGWTQVTCTAAAPSNAAFASFSCYVRSAIATETHFMDSCGLFVGASAPATWLPPVTLPSTGKPAVQFDGVNDSLTNANLPSLAQAFTVFAVAYTNNTGLAQDTISAPDGAAGARRVYFNAANKVQLDSVASFGIVTSTTTYTTALHTISVSYSATTAAIFKDGTADGSAASPPAFSNAGAGIVLSGNPLNGSIAALLIYSRELSTSERQRVERYLKNRFGTP